MFPTRLELHNNNWASEILHAGLSESDVYSDVIQEAQSNDLLYTVRLSVGLDSLCMETTQEALSTRCSMRA